MRLIDFEKYLRNHQCKILREGGNHTIYVNTSNHKHAPVPRHREIKNNLVRRICKQLEIPDALVN